MVRKAMLCASSDASHDRNKDMDEKTAKPSDTSHHPQPMH
jgi:hypothetical protein